jgi:hypothetical protein
MLLSTGLGDRMLKLEAVDWPPPGAGVVTTTWTIALAATRLAGTAAVNSFDPTTVVGNAVAFQ